MSLAHLRLTNQSAPWPKIVVEIAMGIIYRRTCSESRRQISKQISILLAVRYQPVEVAPPTMNSKLSPSPVSRLLTPSPRTQSIKMEQNSRSLHGHKLSKAAAIPAPNAHEPVWRTGILIENPKNSPSIKIQTDCRATTYDNTPTDPAELNSKIPRASDLLIPAVQKWTITMSTFMWRSVTAQQTRRAAIVPEWDGSDDRWRRSAAGDAGRYFAFRGRPRLAAGFAGLSIGASLASASRLPRPRSATKDLNCP